MDRKQNNPAAGKRIMVLEEITPARKWLVMWYLSRGHEIYFIRLNRASKEKRWVKDFIRRGYLKKMDAGSDLYTIGGLYYDMAFDNIDNFYKSVGQNPIVRGIAGLYGNDNISLLFKKSFIEKLVRFYYLNSVFNKIQNKYADKRIIFAPGFSIKCFYQPDNCEIYDYRKLYELAKEVGGDRLDTERIKFPIWATVPSYLHAGKRKLKTLLRLFGLLFWICSRWPRSFLVRKAQERPRYKYAVMVIAGIRQFANKIQKVDFLIDGEAIKKEDAIFLSCITRLGQKNRQYMEDNGLDYMDDVDRFVSGKEIRKALPAFFQMLRSFLKEDSLILEAALKAIFFYLRWESFANNVEIKNLITHSDFGAQSIARNIILERHGCNTYYYMDTTNYGYYLVKKEQKHKCRHSLLGFLYYDYFVSWNDTVPEIMRSSHAVIKNYINLGCFWAEHLKLIEDGKIASDLKDRLYNRGYRDGMRIISVFDSGFSDDSITDYEDGIRFLEGVLKLLEDMPDIFVILKEKQPRNRHKEVTDRYKEILALYKRIEKNKRCYCLHYDLENPWESSSEIIALSDLTISFPFTSTTVEALAARKKGVWYDPTDKYRDTFYDGVPALVCHDYGELLERTKELLSVKGDEYVSYLNTYVNGKIENYLDGKAITRFREHLISCQ